MLRGWAGMLLLGLHRGHTQEMSWCVPTPIYMLCVAVIQCTHPHPTRACFCVYSKVMRQSLVSGPVPQHGAACPKPPRPVHKTVGEWTLV